MRIAQALMASIKYNLAAFFSNCMLIINDLITTLSCYLLNSYLLYTCLTAYSDVFAAKLAKLLAIQV